MDNAVCLSYGGEYFSRGALYSLLQNPVYIGKISHKGKIHEGLHDAIIPLELWNAVQDKLRNQAPHQRGLKRQAHKNLLTGLIFDEYGNPYTPVFTNKKNKKYRYYYNQDLTQDKSHPDKNRSRLPAHEIETLIEKSVHGEITKLSGENDGTALKHLLKHHKDIPTYELIRKCVAHITINFDHLIIKFKPVKFVKLVEKYLRVSITGCVDEFEITVPYETKRGRDGAVVIQSPSNDIFDMPSEDLKKLVQGHIWREEHFAGAYIKDIATRENYSDRYVRNRIMDSFKILNQA